jgi:G:T-mismatch repair DNA endonuclease (very short patch repair protein)
MPLPKLRGGSGHQTSRRAKGMRKISSKDTAKRNNLANKISLRVKNSRQTSFKVYFKAILKEL